MFYEASPGFRKTLWYMKTHAKLSCHVNTNAQTEIWVSRNAILMGQQTKQHNNAYMYATVIKIIPIY